MVHCQIFTNDNEPTVVYVLYTECCQRTPQSHNILNI